MMLPASSRTMIALSPAKDWDWDKETQSLILAKLDMIYCAIGNYFRDKKKSSRLKPDEQWQPPYVKEAKEKAREERETEKRLSEEQLAKIKAFWKHHNPEANFLEEK